MMRQQAVTLSCKKWSKLFFPTVKPILFVQRRVKIRIFRSDACQDLTQNMRIFPVSLYLTPSSLPFVSYVNMQPLSVITQNNFRSAMPQGFNTSNRTLRCKRLYGFISQDRPPITPTTSRRL